MAHRTDRFLTLLLLLATLSAAGCATAAAMRAGQQAELAHDYDRAIVEYQKVLREKPDSRNARLALDRARMRAAEDHLVRGRRLANTGKLDEAIIELQMAAELNPASSDIDDELRAARAQQRTKVAVAREGKTELETLIDRARDLPAQGSELPADVRLPDSMVFRDAGARLVYASIARFANISLVFDPQFRDQNISIDLRNTTLQSALDAVSSATRHFYRVTSQRTVTVIPDTTAKRREYEEDVVRTFYVSNADLKETMDLLRSVVDTRRIAPITATNSLTVKDTPERVAAIAKVLAAIDKARPEVVVDVQLLEVDRTRLKEYGLQIASPGSSGISGAADVNRDGLTLRDVRTLSQSDVFLTNLPGLYYRLLKTDTNTRTLANPQLRTTEGITTSVRFGEMVPVPQTTFTPIATGGIAQQPVTSYAYQNIGVNLDVTPRMHHDNQVSLALKLEVSSISGAGFNGLPTFGNRSVTTVIRLADGETNMLAGLIRDDERKVVRGIPGLSDIPGIGKIFAHNDSQMQETDVILTLTPHIIRVLDLSEEDLRAFRVGRDGTTAGAVIDLPELPAPPRDPVQQQNQAPNPQPPATQPGTFIIQQPPTTIFSPAPPQTPTRP
jgi:general secretion pathway protein D